MARLNAQQLDHLRQHIEAGECLTEILQRSGFKPRLIAEIDEQLATIEIITHVHPDALARLLDAHKIKREILDFKHQPGYWKATWSVHFIGFEIAVTAHHIPSLGQLAQYVDLMEAA